MAARNHRARRRKDRLNKARRARRAIEKHGAATRVAACDGGTAGTGLNAPPPERPKHDAAGDFRRGMWEELGRTTVRALALAVIMAAVLAYGWWRGAARAEPRTSDSERAPERQASEARADDQPQTADVNGPALKEALEYLIECPAPGIVPDGRRARPGS